MPRQVNKGLFHILSILPWYFTVLTAATVYGMLGYLLPNIIIGETIFYRLADTLTLVSPYIAAIFLMPLPVSLFNSWRKGKILDQQNNLLSIKQLSWRNFEVLVGEVYRRRNFKVVENDSAGADGGIDLIIRKNGEKYLIQCKSWRSQKVGVSIVREMLGLVFAENAVGGIIIITGAFTKPALEFAKGKQLELIDGQQLLVMVHTVQKELSYKPIGLLYDNELPCPDCGSKMYLRTAKKGFMAGNKFWGCSKFPGCHGTRDCDN